MSYITTISAKQINPTLDIKCRGQKLGIKLFRIYRTSGGNLSNTSSLGVVMGSSDIVLSFKNEFRKSTEYTSNVRVRRRQAHDHHTCVVTSMTLQAYLKVKKAIH